MGDVSGVGGEIRSGILYLRLELGLRCWIVRSFLRLVWYSGLA